MTMRASDLRLAEHPFAIDQRRCESIEAEAMRLMAGGAERGVDGFAFFKQRGLCLGERFDDRRRRCARLAGPGEPGLDDGEEFRGRLVSSSRT
jgi:hypothetical protein